MLGEPLSRGDCTLVALPARPCFRRPLVRRAAPPCCRLPHELPQLAEHDRGIGARSVERIDAFEPGQDGARFLHVYDATQEDVSTCAQPCNAYVSTPLLPRPPAFAPCGRCRVRRGSTRASTSSRRP